MSKIHFISGLPRSGSTLLAALLKQNPKFKAGMTGPLNQLFNATLRNMSGFNEAHMFIHPAKKARILRGLIDQYYDTDIDNPLIKDGDITYFDTSRGWTLNLPILADLFPDCRMICCVRNVAWIVDSFERILLKNKYELSRMFNFEPGMNVYGRANKMSAPDGVIGGAYNNLRQAFFGEYSDRLMLVEYETLCRQPEHVLKSIYSFIGEEWPEGYPGRKDIDHQYNNVTYSADEFDAALCTPGLHTVSGPVRPFDPHKPTILPPDIFAAHFENDFWNREEARSKSNAIVI